MTFLRESYNAKLRYQGEAEADAMQFLKMVRAKAKTLNMNDDMLKRPGQCWLLPAVKKSATRSCRWRFLSRLWRC